MRKFTASKKAKLTKFDYEYRGRYWMNAAIDMWERGKAATSFEDKHYWEQEAMEYSAWSTDSYQLAAKCQTLGTHTGENEMTNQTVTINELAQAMESNKLELLPGASAQYGPASYPEQRIKAIKAMYQDYEYGLAYAKHSVCKVYPNGASTLPLYVKATEPENTVQDQIDTLHDLQRQMLDVLDNMREVAQILEDNDHNGIAARLETYVIPHIECSVTSDHSWLDSSTSIDSIIEELQDEL